MRVILVICAISLACISLVHAQTTIVHDDPYPSCIPCLAVAELIAPVVRANATKETIYNLAVFGCEIIKPQCNTTAACKDLCLGVIKEHLDIILEIALKTVLAPSEICYLINMCPAPPSPPKPSGDIPVPSNCTDRTGERQWPTWDQHGPGYFIQLSDLHVDMKYTVGSNSVCGEPLCCRQANGPGNASWNTAGQWGDYHCDLPYQTAESLFQHLASLKPPPDFILYTGDDPPHDIWEQSREWNLLAVTKVNGLMNQYLPNVPIFSAVGNHEAFPVNQFEGPPYDDWLNSALAAGWAHYLPTDALHTLRYGGYYTARARPGLRVISLNSNYYSSGNFWLVANNSDYSAQLPWMKDVLKQARSLKEKVIIIGHGVSSGWVSSFTYTYNAIIEQYKDIIIGQFHGHAHASDLRVYRDNATDTTPWNVAYVVGSVVPYQNLNPGWRKYYYDRDVAGSYIATDFEQYWMDIDQANKLGQITDWGTIRYKATDFYGMTNCSPDSWQAALNRAFLDDKLWHHHVEAYFRGAQSRSGRPNRIGLLCDALSASETSWHKCHDHHYTSLYGSMPTSAVTAAAYKQHSERENLGC